MCAITLLAILATPQAPKQWTSYIQSHVTGHTIGRVEGQYYNDEDKQAFRTDKAGYARHLSLPRTSSQRGR